MDDIKVRSKEVRYEDVFWVHLALGSVLWRVVCTLMNLLIP